MNWPPSHSLNLTRSAFQSLALTAAFVSLFSAQELSQSGLELRAPRPMVNEPERAPKAMIASANVIASQAGLSVLRKGGNAVDAAVAVAFALAVVHPEAGNLGGGGYMLIRMADGAARAIDYKETAPAAAHPEMFANRLESTVGYKASAVPGTVAGMAWRTRASESCRGNRCWSPRAGWLKMGSRRRSAWKSSSPCKRQ
jgi:hypothetical protein